MQLSISTIPSAMASDTDSEKDEFSLFRKAVKDAQPIRQQQRQQPQKTPPNAVVRQRKTIANPEAIEPFSDMVADNNVSNEEFLEFRRPGIQHRQFAKLRAGKVHLDAELDLHGLTSDRAEPMLSAFLAECQQQQIRCVRIIHGKGWGSRDNRPVLKSKVNFWLRQTATVLAFCSCTVEDGGTGALYVLLKKEYAK